MVSVTAVTTKPSGAEQVGATSQVTSAIHPALCTEPSLKNWKVKAPVGCVEIKDPGLTVP